MCHKRVIGLLVLAFMLIMPPALSIGISFDSPEYIIAEPGKTFTSEFYALGHGKDTKEYVDGDFSEYVVLSEPEVTGPFVKKYSFTVIFPDEINATPGMHRMVIGTEEIISVEQQGIATKASVQKPLKVFVLYPDYYIESWFSTQNVNVNETADFTVGIKNLGMPDIVFLTATVEIYNLSGTKIREIKSERYSLESGKDKEIRMRLDTRGMQGGAYNATATVYYDGNIKVMNDSFRIGQMRISVANYTNDIFADRINRFEVEVENEWNGGIEGVFANITIMTGSGNLSSKTASENVEPLSRKTLVGYIDTEGVIAGEYPVLIEAYHGKDKSVRRGTVNIMESSILQRAENLGIDARIAGAVIAIAVIVTVLNLVLFFKRKR